MAETEVSHQYTSSYLRKRRKKGRYIKQGYHKSERDDSRRVAARSFLSGITRDSHLQNCGQAPAQDEGNTGNLFLNTSLSRKLSIGPVGSIERNPSPPSTPVLEARYLSSPTSKLLHDVSLESPKRTPTKHVLLAGTKSLDYVTDSHLSGLRSSTITYLHTEQSELSLSADGTLYTNKLPSPSYYETARSGRVVLTTPTGTLLSVYSVIPYNKYVKLRQENPKREGMRVRANSLSLQMDLDGIELGTQEEVSLAFLLDPLWIPSEQTQPISDHDTPSLSRRQSTRRGETSGDKRSSTPTSQSRHHVNPELLLVDFRRDSFPGQLYRDHHSPTFIVLNYHPLCVDNEEYFVGRRTTTFTPQGYRVSIIEYAKKSDIKRGLNERFKEMYPHIELPLTKLRKVKRKMCEIAEECNLDLVAISYAYVYYEKLVLMGKIHRSIRWTVAGVCLLLAAKFTLDLKKQDITNLINEITDHFPVSSRELLLYEFPVLASLQFSLLTPTFQVQPHLDRLCEGTTPLSAGH